MRLELVRNGEVFSGRRTRLVLRCDQSVSRCSRRFPERKRRARDETRFERARRGSGCGHEGDRTGDRPQQSFLGYIFSVSRIAQDAASHAVSERPHSARRSSNSRLVPAWAVFAHQLILDRATWLDQNQLLHLLSRASLESPPSLYT